LLQSGQKLTLGLLATISLKVVPFHAYAPFPALMQFFKCILEAVFCESVQHRLQFCLDHHSCVKMSTFQFYLQLGKQRKVGWVGGNSHVVFSQKFPGERRSEKVHCHDATSSSFVAKVRSEAFTHFHAVAIERHSSCGIDCLACQDELFVNNPLDVKEMMSILLTSPVLLFLSQ
jgi:hypothetical protein